MSHDVYIASIGTAVPPLRISQGEALDFMRKYYAPALNKKSRAIVEKVFSHPSIKYRHFACDQLESLINEDPDKRIERFTEHAINLSQQAILSALDKAGAKANEISALVVNTCTGYICPGLSTYLIERLDLSPQIRAYDLVGSGCGGAVANLQMSEALLKERGEGIVLSVAVEICSATFEMGNDPGLIVSNAIFADGAAAAILWTKPQGLRLESSISRFAPKHRDHVRYVYKQGRLHNKITPYIPQLTEKEVGAAVRDLLSEKGLDIKDIKYWTIHPGGEKVIETVKKSLNLSDTQLAATRQILSGYGNMSSPTVWFVLNNLMKNSINENDWGVMISYGAGFSLHAYLLVGALHATPPQAHSL